MPDTAHPPAPSLGEIAELPAAMAARDCGGSEPDTGKGNGAAIADVLRLLDERAARPSSAGGSEPTDTERLD